MSLIKDIKELYQTMLSAQVIFTKQGDVLLYFFGFLIWQNLFQKVIHLLQMKNPLPQVLPGEFLF